MDKIIHIGEHNILLPELPKDKREILFVDNKKDDAFWQREILLKEYRQIWFDFIPHFTKIFQSATLYDQDNILISLNTEDSNYIIRIYEQEKERRLNGVWFKNGEEFTWITGSHYFFLMWSRIQRHDGNGNFGDYREFQRDYFYLIHHCNVSSNILGLFCSKPKKTGITNLHWSGYYLNKATMFKNKNLGYMNIDLNQAAKTFRDYFLYSYFGLIPALRPEWKNKSENEGSIIFGKAYNNSKKSKLLSYETEDELNTSVFCVPTKDKAFDVAVMNDITFDEPTKTKQPFGEIWETNKEAVKIQSKFNGRAWLFNYTIGEDTDSFRECKNIFFDSELRTITPHSKGKTNTGLICYHIPAYAAWEAAFDKHGRCNEKAAHEEITNERLKYKSNPRLLQTLIRQYANDKREAWQSSGTGSTFDPIRLGDLYSDIEEEERNSINPPYVEGNLLWEINLWNIGLKNKRRKGEFCNVKFVPLTEDERERGVVGKYRFYEEIHPDIRNLALKQGRDEYGNLLAPQRFYYVGGGDPTQYAAGSEVTQGSKNALYTMSVPNEQLDNALRKIATKKMVAEYYYRPELPDEAFEDFLKLILYTGQLSLIEANAPYVATRLLEEGLGNYMIVKDENDFFTTWKRFMGMAHESPKLYKLVRISSNSQISKEMLETLIRVIKNYMEKPEEGAKDYGKTIKSLRLIKQKQEFNPLDTKTSDLVMAWGYTLLCLDIYLDILISGERYNPENEYANVLLALAS